jgi:hypothetical protein
VSSRTKEQRPSLEDLRAKIEASREAPDVSPATRGQEFAVRALTSQVVAWQAAYLWHAGITQKLLSGFPLGGDGAQKDEYEAMEWELQEGASLIRERLPQP